MEKCFFVFTNNFCRCQNLSVVDETVVKKNSVLFDISRIKIHEIFQLKFNVCGISNYTDWKKSTFYENGTQILKLKGGKSKLNIGKSENMKHPKRLFFKKKFILKFYHKMSFKMNALFEKKT